MPGARARALGALAAAAADGRVALDPQGLRDGAGALRDLPGVGEWTAQVLAMRSGDPDAFPAGDLGVRRALGVAGGREAEARAERWRPWRAYAAMHLWTTLAQGAQR
jgi:AraC family transcriptional regulator of adaptative response / DNA-3-methyladenine glycosylase II